MIISVKKAASSVEETAFVLFPITPNLRAVAHGGLFSVADNGRFHHLRMIENLVFLCPDIVGVFQQGDNFRLTFPINQIVDPANGTQNAVKFLTGKAEADQVNGLVFHPPFFEPTLRFLCVEAFGFSKYLYVQ